jgi:hypothetical protein
MFCALGIILGVIEGDESHFHFLRSRTRFGRYRGNRVPFLSFALPDSFSTVPRALGLVFMFCAPGHFFGGTEAVGARFHVMPSRTLFGRYLGRRVLISSFALPDSFLTVSMPSWVDFMFCAPGLFLFGTEDAGSHFHVSHSRTRLGRYRGRREPF